jgi:hypothetical protein
VVLALAAAQDSGLCLTGPANLHANICETSLLGREVF